MKKKTMIGLSMITVAGVLLAGVLNFKKTHAGDLNIAVAPNGIAFPKDYKDWRIIAPSYRTDNNTMRVILGNDAAIKAARAGRTSPWPDGSILAKLVWKNKKDENWDGAIVPGNFVHAEFMFKDTGKYADTGGWGYARWLGEQQKPYGDDASFVEECHTCHTVVKESDYVFTNPVRLR